MTKAELYQQEMAVLAPSAAWREQTLSAMKDAQAPASPKRRSALAFAAVLVLLAGCGILGLRWLLAPTEPGGTAVLPPVQTPIASQSPSPTQSPVPSAFPGGVFSKDPGYTASADLPKLTLSSSLSDGMGAFDDSRGMLIVRDPEEQASQNPTLDNTGGIVQLPVYPNPIPSEAQQLALAERAAAALGTAVVSHEAGVAQSFAYLTAECENGIHLTVENLIHLRVALPQGLESSGEAFAPQAPRLYDQLAPLAGFLHPALEVTRDYNFDGQPNDWFFWFEQNEEKPLADQLLDYTFSRIGDEFYSSSLTEPFRYFQLPLWPAEQGTLYPIRTAQEAEADFRAGNFLSVDQPTDTENASILHMELVYLTQPYQAYLQPAYKITYTQDYWDTSAVMDRAEDPEGYTSVSHAYVPAVAEEYVELQDVRLQFN